MRYFGGCRECDGGLLEWTPIFENSSILGHLCSDNRWRYFYDHHYFREDELQYWFLVERRSK